jgi:hypothetical protein
MEIVNELMGRESYNYIVKLSFSATGSRSETITSPTDKMRITKMKTYLKFDGSFIRPDSEQRDEVTLQVQDMGNNSPLFGGTAIDILEFNDIGLDFGFNGFTLPANARMSFTATHIPKSWTDPAKAIDVFVVFHGTKIR